MQSKTVVMRETRMKRIQGFFEKNKKKILLAAGIMIVVVLLAGFIVQWRRNEKEKEVLEQGVGYLKSLEQKDLDEINGRIKALKAEMVLNQAEEEGTVVWRGFEDAVILGDSRAVGFSYFEFLPEERVLAREGGRITDATDYIEDLKAINPGQIFLCYGLNDIEIGYWPEPEEYSAKCAEIISELTAELPYCDVYLNSVLPVIEEGLEKSEDYSRIDEYNNALEIMCEENGYTYVDNTSISEENVDLYEADGIHMKIDFYEIWAANMLTEVK